MNTNLITSFEDPELSFLNNSFNPCPCSGTIRFREESPEGAANTDRSYIDFLLILEKGNKFGFSNNFSEGCREVPPSPSSGKERSFGGTFIVGTVKDGPFEVPGSNLL